MAQPFTTRQGQYLAYMHTYIKINKRPPAESDIAAYFRVSPPAAHMMVVALENRGLIRRIPGVGRSIQLLVPPETLPDIDGNDRASGSFDARYPHIAYWVAEGGRIELGYDLNTGTFARAVDDRGLVWSGGHRHETLDANLHALDQGIEEWRSE